MSYYVLFGGTADLDGSVVVAIWIGTKAFTNPPKKKGLCNPLKESVRLCCRASGSTGHERIETSPPDVSGTRSIKRWGEAEVVAKPRFARGWSGRAASHTCHLIKRQKW